MYNGNIVERIFARSKADVSRLLEYGFRKKDEGYEYQIALDECFELLVYYQDFFSIKVLDRELDEEYLGYHHKDSAFGNMIANRIEAILLDIRDYACTALNYRLPQANRLDEYLSLVYGLADFVFGDEETGVYRTTANGKWYAIIMMVPYNKVVKGSAREDLINVINIKAEKDKIKDLLEKEGIYPAYHMNKANWLSIILDDSISDYDIILLVNESYDLVIRNNEKKNYYRRKEQ